MINSHATVWNKRRSVAALKAARFAVFRHNPARSLSPPQAAVALGSTDFARSVGIAHDG